MSRESTSLPSWSMFPSLHDDVMKLLEDCGLTFAFHDAGKESCIKEHDTNIMGSFLCDNSECAGRKWSSKIISINIRMYSGRRYNARVYNQRCKVCNRISMARLDHSYAERVAYRLKKWSGVQVEIPNHGRVDNNRPPHISRLCEGCKAGHCRLG